MTAIVLGLWTLTVFVAGLVAAPNRVRWSVRAAPLKGSFDQHLTGGTIVVLVVGLALARFLPGRCRRTSWRGLLALVVVASLGWGLALALTRGVDGIDRGLGNRQEYPAVIDHVDRIGLGTFVDTFTEEEALRTYPIHIQGHPLGAALLFVGLDRVGLGGPAGAAAFILVVSSSGVVAVLLAVREVAGGDAARRAGPFLALMPGLVWWVTSADALYATVAAWGIALLVLSTRPGALPRRAALLAVGSGVVWGIGIHLTYGLAPLVLVGVTTVVVRRRWSVLGWAGLGGIAVIASSTIGLGFWWFDGLAATKIRYFDGVASVRSNLYFGLLGNPAAFALAIGPAAWVAVARVRDRRLLQLAIPALVAVAIADASGLSKAEVERIWLPFAPWVLLLAAGLADPLIDRPAVHPADASTVAAASPRWRPPWWCSPGWPALASGLLIAQVVLAVVVETFVSTSW